MDNLDTKKIIIIEETCKQGKLTKKINCEKERKLRVETKTWGLDEQDISHQTQLECLLSSDFIENKQKDTYISKLSSHIKQKINNYRQQDIIKKKLDNSEFVSYEETIELLKQSKLKCCYCSDKVYILYEYVREKKQWSLDRVNNDIGHNSKNLVIACLECNLKRRRTNKEAFMFTKNMIIIKEDN